ncbi:MAG TPA: PAS domain S-box protein [Verrucomicrobiae bacterium]|nr:PAS domain S-box protein [Verrucomicrobiae bacterium]
MSSDHPNVQVPGHDTRIVRSFRASELFYRRLLETAREGILILDFDTGRIKDVNPFLFRLLGFNRAEMVGKILGELSPFKDTELGNGMWEQLQKSGQVRFEDLPLETKDGCKITVEFTGNVYQASGRKLIQCHVRDITERKHAEDEIWRLNAEMERRVVERTAQLQAVNEELQALGYIVSHDLRTPLRQVGGVVKQLQKNAGPALSKKNRQHLAMISESAKLMSELVEDLLTFSRAGSATRAKAEIDLDELMPKARGEARVKTPEGSRVRQVDPEPPAPAGHARPEARGHDQSNPTEIQRQEYSRTLRSLAHRLVEAQETERRNIARELHDEIGQALTVTQLNLQEMLQSPGAEDLKPRLNESLQEVERVLEQVQDISLDLRPSMLDDLGLEAALVWLTNRQAAVAGLKAEVQTDPLKRRLDMVIETECYRIAQEALTNVVRHARAHAVFVELRAVDGQLHLRVRDDGVGFDVAATREKAVSGGSLGLLSMEERAVLGEGRLELASGHEQGTEVHAWFPLRWRTAHT